MVETKDKRVSYDSTFVKNVANTVEKVEISPTAAQLIGDQVALDLKAVLEQAGKFQRHARRQKMVGDDFENALAHLGHNPQTGFSIANSVSMSSYGPGAESVSLSGTREVDVRKLYQPVNSGPKPIAMSLHAHWLVIEGVQPLIPENPAPEILPHTLEKKKDGRKHERSISDSPYLIGSVTKDLLKTEQVQIKTTTTHSISLEQQIFFNKIMELIISSSAEQQRLEAITTLRNDCGLQPLVPRFVCAIVDGICINLVAFSMNLIGYLLRALQALNQNPNVDLEECLHQVVPSVISCIVSTQLTKCPEVEDHWVLRTFATDLLVDIVNEYKMNRDLLPRIIKILCTPWSRKDESLNTLYGSLFALHKLEFSCYEKILWYRLKELYEIVRKQTIPTERREPTKVRTCNDKLNELLLVIFEHHIQTTNANPASFEDYKKMFGPFGKDVQQHHASIKTLP
uniref:TAF domain-containing protein n=1 Tax=Rhabditophanes sp. KR3021 TaxID=114890 RepID=A0AC35UF66_9BILA